MFDMLATLPWWAFCIWLIIGTAVYGIVMRYVPAGMHPSVFSLIFTASSLIVLLFVLILYGASNTLAYTLPSLACAAMAGVFITGVDYGVIRMYQEGAPVSLGMPIIRIALSCGTALLGIFFFYETMTIAKGAGIILGGAGIYLSFQK